MLHQPSIGLAVKAGGWLRLQDLSFELHGNTQVWRKLQMSSLDETFDALSTHLRHPQGLNPAKSDPFFYFVHDPADTLAIKQRLGVWSSVLRNEGWTIVHVSLSKLIWEIVD